MVALVPIKSMVLRALVRKVSTVPDAKLTLTIVYHSPAVIMAYVTTLLLDTPANVHRDIQVSFPFSLDAY